MQLSPRLQRTPTSRTAETDDNLCLAVPEERRGFQSPAAKMTPFGEPGCRKRSDPSSPERLQSALVCILVAQQRQHAGGQP